MDVLIVGAGLSGIAAGCHLEASCPVRSRDRGARRDPGGTWELFRYPGIRSDSDMFTLGYRFRPWTGTQALADGPATLAYIRGLSCAFLLVCSGYYGYDEGHSPAMAGAQRFAGQIVHPQQWSEQVQYAGRRVSRSAAGPPR